MLGGVSNAAGANYMISTFFDVLVATRVELALFAAAVVTYAVLFSDVFPKSSRSSGRFKAKTATGDSDDDVDAGATLRGGAGASGGRLQKSAAAAHGKDVAARASSDPQTADHRAVLRQWNAMQTRKQGPSVPLSRAVEAMQLLKKDAHFILQELRTYLAMHHGEESVINSVNDLLDSLAKRVDLDFMQAVAALLPAAGISWTARTYEIFLAMNFTLRQFSEVKTLVAEMKSKGVTFTARAAITVVKTALKTGDFEEARLHFQELKATWAAHASTPSAAPRHLVAQLVDLACKEHQLHELLPQLQGTPVSPEAVHTMLQECIWQRDVALTRGVEQLARGLGVQFSERTYTLLLKGFSGDTGHGRRILEETLGLEDVISSTELAAAAAATCGHCFDPALASRVRQRLREMQGPVLAAFIRFYVEHEMFNEVCDLYEEELRRGVGERGARTLGLDGRTERAVLDSALRCGRTALARELLNASPSNVAQHITMIRKYASEGNLKGALEIFASLQRNMTDMNSIIYNSVIDACVECRDIEAAEYWMQQTRKAGMVDAASYNTLIKAQLAMGCFDKARCLLEDMKKEDIQPNRVTYNELLNAAVVEGNRQGRGGAGPHLHSRVWGLVEEMREAGVSPNQITLSILMKSLSAHSDELDVVRTMDLIGGMEEPVDEVLLSSVVEACVRVGKPELVTAKLQQFQNKDGVSVTSSHTFGSIIKAHGFAKDIDAVWRCWKEMRSRHIRPSSVTLGCMVEAVVSNGDPEGAYELISQLQEEESCRDVVNSVVYCSVLKGFTRERKLDRVWTVYEEMRSRKVDLSVVTYNTLIDACARCGHMDRVPALRDDMVSLGVTPNVITYSTMVKGHCQAGDLTAALKLLDQMRKETGLKPDEIMYNSLLDGCAQGSHVEEGLRLLAQMQQQGVPPSNFTLSVVVKLMSRARRLNRAFELVEEITAKYHIQVNSHVYNNLIQACITNRDFGRAMGVWKQMVQEKVQPDNRTFTILIRASLQQGFHEQAAGLLRAALGLSGVPQSLCVSSGSAVACAQLDHSLVNEALNGLAESRDLALSLLSDIRQHRPRVRIEAAIQRRLMLPASAAPLAPVAGPGGRSSWRGGGSSSGGRGGRGGVGGGGKREWGTGPRY